MSPAPDNSALDRYRGCILGLAAGDALGAPVEFMSWSAIRNIYGDTGIRDYAEGHYGRGRITDDTQMTVATAKGLLRASVGRGAAAGGTGTAADGTGTAVVTPAAPGSTVDLIYQSYLDWLRTQSDPAQRRGPGNTCLTALGSGLMGTIEHPINDSKGCGGVMRVAPVGLAFPGRPVEAFEMGAASAAITHGHPGGYLPSGFLAALIARALAPENGPESAGSKDGSPTLLGLVTSMLAGTEGGSLDGTSAALLRQAVELAKSNAAPRQALPALGEGWTGDEALAIAVYCALRYPESLEEAVVAAVNHSGDSDSTGSITGAIVGAHLGAAAIPWRWLDVLEGREELEATAVRLYEAFGHGVTGAPGPTF